MKFISTRDKNRVVTFKEAVFQGLSPEGGLFVPDSTPDLSKLYAGMTADTPFNESAIQLTAAVMKDEMDRETATIYSSRSFSTAPPLHSRISAPASWPHQWRNSSSPTTGRPLS